MSLERQKLGGLDGTFPFAVSTCVWSVKLLQNQSFVFHLQLGRSTH